MSLLRKSISRNTLDDEVLRTSTLKQSRIEKEVLSPVEEPNPENTVLLHTTINNNDEDNVSMLHASTVLSESQLPEKKDGLYDSSAVIYSKKKDEQNVSEIEVSASDYSPVIAIKCLPPYEQIRPAETGFLLPPATTENHAFTLVLDLDETLVHCSLQPMKNCHFCYHIHLDGHQYSVYSRVRPYTRQFLEYCSQFCDIVIFTASKREYADRMLDFLDPEKQTIKYRLYREHCTKVGNLYIKDLNRLGRDLKRTVIIDNSIVSFAYHLSNGIPIRSWYDDWEDRELYSAAKIMYRLQAMTDVRPVIENLFELQKIIDCFEIGLLVC